MLQADTYTRTHPGVTSRHAHTRVFRHIHALEGRYTLEHSHKIIHDFRRLGIQFKKERAPSPMLKLRAAEGDHHHHLQGAGVVNPHLRCPHLGPYCLPGESEEAPYHPKQCP